MDMRRRIPKPPVNSAGSYDDPRRTVTSPPPKASDALPLPLYLTNAVFFTLFFSVAYYLLQRWRDKIRYNTPLHVVTIAELGAIISLIASLIYFIGFFGIDFVQSFISRADSDDSDSDFLLTRSQPPPPQQILSVAKSPNPEPVVTESLHEEDEEIVKSVIDGSL